MATQPKELLSLTGGNEVVQEDAKTKAIRKLVRALRQARTSIDPLIPTQLLQAFLAVGVEEGRTLTELAEELGTNISTASRQLMDLGDRNRKMQEGYRLVERKTDPMNLRVNRYSLTPKGRLLYNELAAIIQDD